MGSSRHVDRVDPGQVGALAEVIDGQGMLEELAPWPGAEVFHDVFCAVKGWAVASSGLPEAGGAEERVERRIREVVCNADWITGELREALEAVRGLFVQSELGRWGDGKFAYEQIAMWAENNRLPITRFCFAAVSALVAHDDFWSARRVALLARELAQWRASLRWFAHTANIARQAGAWDEHVRAILGFGNTHYQRGNYSKARRALRRALHLARKHSVKELEGCILHDLAGLAVETHHTAAAERYARFALAAYGPGHENIPALTHDLVSAWIRDGYAERALYVIQALLPFLESKPIDRLKALANMAHAAAVSGDRVRFRTACSQVSEASRLQTAANVRPGIVLQLAYGAASLAEWSLAKEFASVAMEGAVDRGEVDVIGKADSLLKSIASRIVPVNAAAARPRAGGAARKPALPADGAGDLLAEHLIRSMVAGDVLRLAQAPRPRHPAVDLFPHRSGPLTPFSAAQAHHTALRRCAWSARIVEYASFSLAAGPDGSEGWEKVLHVQAEGSPSFNRAIRRDVPPPHVHDPSAPGGVRTARPDEIPARPW